MEYQIKGRIGAMIKSLFFIGAISLFFAFPSDVTTFPAKPKKDTKISSALSNALKDERVETSDVVAQRIRRALEYIPVERLYVSPDCGMKFMPRDRAFAKLKAMVDGTRIVRRELKLE